MSTFTALNIEPESDSEDEIDNSREIQIEEALKLYQNALKLHSQGPHFYDEAEEAYNALFRSEVFTYLESLSESQRVDYYDGEAANDQVGTDPVTAATTADGAPSTLPQILYLSYKNHGHFLLDRLKWRLQKTSKQISDQALDTDETEDKSAEIASSLKLLVEAVDRDDTDVELWRQLSKIGESLGSKRIARFCLEAVLDREDVAGNAWPEPLGLQELFAVERLRSLLQVMEDDISWSTLPRLTRKQRGIVQSFKAHMDPLPYLPTPPPEGSGATIMSQKDQGRVDVQNIVVPLRSWASCGKAILLHLQQEAQGLGDIGPGACCALVFPSAFPAVHPKPSAISSIPGTANASHASRALDAESSRRKSKDEATSIPQHDGLQEEQISPQELNTGSSPPPTPEIATADADILEQKVDIIESGEARQNSVFGVHSRADQTRTMTLPTRKRSNEATEIEDAEDTGRSKSKRIKARTSIEEPASGREARARQQLALYQEGELQYFNVLDERAFGQSAELLSILGIDGAESVRDRRGTIVALARTLKESNGEDISTSTKSADLMLKDLTISLYRWTCDMSNMFLHGGGFEDPISGAGVANSSGLLLFLEHSGMQARESVSKIALEDDRGLDAFVTFARSRQMHTDQLALAWIKSLLSRDSVLQDAADSSALTAYEDYLWPDNLKEAVVQMLVRHDEFVFCTLSDDVEAFVESRPKSESAQSTCTCPHTEMIQNIFELHLDIYGRITNPSSEVDVPTRTAQLDRLQRWASLAYQIRKSGDDLESDEASDDLSSVRFLWAYAVLANLHGTCSQDLVILYFGDLMSTLKRVGRPVIQLRNNAIMPEISVEAAEKQISRLTTMDFFVSVFSPSNDDPIALIETLEPILENSMRRDRSDQPATTRNMTDTADNAGESPEAWQGETVSQNDTKIYTEQMLQFLDKASLPMQLMLWRRLIDAYSVIQYSPRILWCYLRCIALIVNHLQSAEDSENTEEERQKLLLRWLKSLDDLLAWTLALAWSDAQSLDCMDEANLQGAIVTLTRLQYMLLPVIVMDDLLKIGLCSPPSQLNNSANIAYNNSMVRLRDMIVRVWTLRYILMRDGVSQKSKNSSVIQANLFECLTSIHRSLGPRNYCRLADRIFLKLARRELSKIGNIADSELEGAQIILDMYGMKICPGSKDIEDHECPPETLYRSDAVEIMDRVLIQANKFSIKDLIKSDLRVAVEKMQQAIRTPKNTSSVLHNRRVFSEFLRRPVNPRNLSRALHGIGELHFQQPHGDSFRIAEKGWYFLQGQLALVKFRSQKRTSTAGSDELDVAMKFFEYDIEQGYEKWETWYRLAQVYDAKIEEETTWTADNLNTQMEDIVKLQRSAIHCYTMAVATAERCPEPTLDIFQKVADLYSDFGIRIYGSSREPFSMEALSVENFTKHFNAGRMGTWQGEPFKAITLYGAWRLASGLFRRALVYKPDHWVTWYMLGKCLWKMHNCSDNVLSGHNRIDFQPPIDAFKTAIEALPERRDAKHSEKDPTLEPRYKLVSVVHKLVSSRRLVAEAGCQILYTTSYSRKVPPVQDLDDWEGYILSILKVLRGADKSNWHHRMVLRSARTIYDESPNDHMATLAARHELTQQIFTKTMTLQVWKPENERTGRHFVYTTRYVQFFLRLLYELNDRAGVEALGRQIRKKPGKFFRHTRLWYELCTTHLKLLRIHSALPEELSDSVFKNISHDVFVQNADRLEAWAQLPSTDSSTIDILREAIELKKTNTNLMKPTAIEDFIADAYAQLHRTIVPEIIARSNEEESRGRMRVDHLMNIENPPASTPSPGPAANPEDPAPTRQRIRGVGRRELQKRAEAMVNKPVAQQAAAKAPKTPPLGHGSMTPRSTIQVMIPLRSPTKENNSSIPGSVHDSADDESELSDVEDTLETAKGIPLFPNLGDSRDGADEVDEEEKEGSERAGDEQGDEEEELGDGEGEGEESYHTPMEM